MSTEIDAVPVDDRHFRLVIGAAQDAVVEVGGLYGGDGAQGESGQECEGYGTHRCRPQGVSPTVRVLSL